MPMRLAIDLLHPHDYTAVEAAADLHDLYQS